jgi:hypothetical protein
MVEASPVKFYIAKYFSLVVALVLWTVAGLLLLFGEITLPYIILDVLFFILGLILVYLFYVVSGKIKRVAIGENKFVVLEGNSNTRFEWQEVKSFTILPFINLCKVKVRGKRGTFYFFFAGNLMSSIRSLAQSIAQKKTTEPGQSSGL